MPKQLVARAVVAAVLLSAALAHAQERDPAAAQALFDEARALMNTQRYAEACQKLAESLRLDPGIGTQFHLAVCREHEGKLASAWAAFLEVASLATASGQPDRAQAASRRASLLEPRLPRLKITVPATARVPGLEITRDGVVVGEAQWELALPIDPGDHQLEVTAPGRRASAQAVRATEGTTVAFEVTPLEPVAEGDARATPAAAPSAAPASQQPPLSAAAPAAVQPAQVDEPSSGPSGLVIGLGVGGIVMVGAGTVLGLIASGKNDDSKAHCDPEDVNLCDDEGVALRDDAFLFGNLATAGFIAGGAAIAGAVVVWLLEGEPESSADATLSVQAGPRDAGLALKGRF